MRMTFALLLLLFPAVAFAGEQSTATQMYLEELQYNIEEILAKKQHGVASEFDEFKLTKLQERLNQYTVEYVPRAVFSPQVVNREPTQVVTVAPKNSQVFFFTELINMQGMTAEHVYVVEGVVVHRQPFNIGAPRWRVWSSVSTRNAQSFDVLLYVDGHLVVSKRLSVQ